MNYEQEISAVLEPEEKIVWQGVINRKASIFYHTFALLVVLAFAYYPFSQEIIEYTSNGIPKTASGPTVGWIILAPGIALCLLSFFSDYVKRYVITSKRVLLRSGLVGTDFNSIYFTQVRSVNVKVGLIDKIFSVGSLNIDTGKIETVTSSEEGHATSQTRTAYDKLLHIDNPYEVYKYFQETLSDRQESLYSGRADMENNP